jgi:hypothetical protein
MGIHEIDSNRIIRIDARKFSTATGCRMLNTFEDCGVETDVYTR